MWEVEYTKRFLKELSRLPKEFQSKAEDIVFKDIVSSNPFDLGCIEQMTGYPGKYRIGITIDKQSQLIICQRIAHRKDIYKIFP